MRARMRAIFLVGIVLFSLVAVAGVATAKPVCVAGADCGPRGDGLVCRRYDGAGGYWTDCVVDWGSCGILYHRCVPPPGP